jgi:hypothetical protein
MAQISGKQQPTDKKLTKFALMQHDVRRKISGSNG